MHLEIQHIGRVVVISLKGRLTVEEDTRILHRLVGRLTRSGGRNLVLDLQQVTGMDCCGLGQLVELCCVVRRSGAALTLVNLQPRQRRMLELAGLLPVLTTCDTLEQALLQDVRSARPPLTIKHNQEWKEQNNGVHNQDSEIRWRSGIGGFRTAGAG